MTPAELERFLTHVYVEGTCWRWRGYRDPKGYARFRRADRTMRLVHRLAYEHFIAAIPAGLTIDHVKNRGCLHRDCCNPTHLEAVTQRENNNRGESVSTRFAARTHCKRGHKLGGDNMTANKEGFRTCRACNRLKSNDSKRRQRAAARRKAA